MGLSSVASSAIMPEGLLTLYWHCSLTSVQARIISHSVLTSPEPCRCEWHLRVPLKRIRLRTPGLVGNGRRIHRGNSTDTASCTDEHRCLQMRVGTAQSSWILSHYLLDPSQIALGHGDPWGPQGFRAACDGWPSAQDRLQLQHGNWSLRMVGRAV